MNPGIASAAADAPSTEAEALARLERFGGQRLLDEMITLFLKSAPERLSAAASGVAAGDSVATENALHALKASAAQLGALRLSRLCDEGEAIARSGGVASIAELIDAGRRELALVEVWLNGVRTERPA